MKTRPFCGSGLATLAAAILLLGSPCVTTRADVLQENALLSAAKAAHDNDSLLEVLSIEPKALEADDASAGRQGDRLVLRLSSGGTKAYEDRRECRSEDPRQQSRCQKYRLIAHARSRGVFVLIKAYYEGSKYLLVNDATGDEATLPSFPILSASGQHAVVLLMDDGVLGFAIQVWRREGPRFVLDWEGSPHVEGIYTWYKLVRWPSENTIQLQAKIDFAPPRPDAIRHFSLQHAAQGWEIIESR